MVLKTDKLVSDKIHRLEKIGISWDSQWYY
jgi:hypothetical protein